MRVRSGEGKISEDQWSGVERVRSVRISGMRW